MQYCLFEQEQGHSSWHTSNKAHLINKEPWYSLSSFASLGLWQNTDQNQLWRRKDLLHLVAPMPQPSTVGRSPRQEPSSRTWSKDRGGTVSSSCLQAHVQLFVLYNPGSIVSESLLPQLAIEKILLIHAHRPIWLGGGVIPQLRFPFPKCLQFCQTQKLTSPVLTEKTSFLHLCPPKYKSFEIQAKVNKRELLIFILFTFLLYQVNKLVLVNTLFLLYHTLIGIFVPPPKKSLNKQLPINFQDRR